ncbi:HEAT repeat domain-containing protein [bacterium]|nr:HEAT repeat domain-containing protein [bacterium]
MRLSLLTVSIGNVILLFSMAASSHAQGLRPVRVEFRPGDHLCIVGNTLADRMQHDGWLEALLQVRFPKEHLVIRNLGFSGDELVTRLRSAGFGTPDEHLSFSKADVIFAFFGYNESYRDAAGLEAFKKELADFITHTLAQKYNDKTPPRLVIFSPIAHENLGNPNLSDGVANNRRLELYTAAMKEVAAAQQVPFVDLFHATGDLYEKIDEPLTINGIHLNELGNRYVATLIDSTLFGPAPTGGIDEGFVEQVRDAVKEKNFFWFNRYRTTDGFSIFGGRADLKFVGGQTNRIVMQREMEVLDVITANRDQRVWAAAERQPFQNDDNNTPPFIDVKSNKPGDGPGGIHLFLDGQQSIEKMTVAKNMKVNLVASEKEFSNMINPVQMSFDTKGRLWVATWNTYPHWKPKEQMNDKLLIVEDDNNDGVADRVKTFADNLHNPTGFEFWGGGVFVAMAPDLLFLKDTDGDDKADVRVRVLSGLDSADTHHAANSFTLDPMGGLYFQEGTFHHTQVETPYGPPQRCANAGVFRYVPRTQSFEVYVTHGFANPHGHAFDAWGQDFIFDGTGSQPYHGALFSGRLDFPQKHPSPPQVYQQRTRPCPGVEILSSRHFPDELQGNLLVGNVIGFQGILQYKLADDGASFAGTEVEPIVASTDPNFRPSDLEMGPDGALWFTDWQNPIIGHMQHNLRDPNRDRIHGRIYRITHTGRPTLKPIVLAGMPIDQLVATLTEPEDRTRYRARIELSGRPSDEVIPAIERWIVSLDSSSPPFERYQLEALWIQASHNRPSISLLEKVLASKDPRARSAAIKVLCYHRDKVPNAIDRLRRLVTDDHPRVRLEAIRAASFFDDARAVSVVLAAASQPTDRFIDYTRTETLRALEPLVRKALVEGVTVDASTEDALRVMLRSVNTSDLLAAQRNRLVYEELLLRRGVSEEVRRRSLFALAEETKRTPVATCLAAMDRVDAPGPDRDEGVAYEIARLLLSFPGETIAAQRDRLEEIAQKGLLPLNREVAQAALIAADGKIDRAWAKASTSLKSLRDIVNAMPLIKDLSLRNDLFEKSAPLLTSLPESLSGEKDDSGTIRGRYVRVELVGKRTLTLAEVEVYADGQNVARAGKATQKDTSNNGDAARGIDGNTSPEFGKQGQTHSAENTLNPWWEVDLGEEKPIETVVVFNRQDGFLGRRLDGYSVVILDANRKVLARRDNLPVPNPAAKMEFGQGDPKRSLRRAAMMALASVPGRESAAFALLAPQLSDELDRPSVMEALLKIPSAAWPKDQAGTIAATTLAFLSSLPVTERTSPAALNAQQVGATAASLLPADESRAIGKKLRELGVNVIRLATIPDRMLYDKEMIVVEMGKPVEIVFENTDIMPHNLVIGRPGSLEKIGIAGEQMATEPTAVERQYVPKSDQIYVSSRLLQPRDRQRISFIGPREAGVFPFVCTYPGHWRRMYGSMYVVPDMEAYLAQPESYLASQQIKPVDELLQFTKPRQEWKLDDLAPSLADLSKSRSFTTGKQVFQSANCVACHRLQGAGYEIGPDLAKIDPKQTPADILKSMLIPSDKIDPKFATQVIELESGNVVTGLITEENDEIIKIVENPLTKSDPKVIRKSEIESRQASATSIMPLGMVDRLTREEILDLLAYVAAGGKEDHPIYAEGHHQHGGH